MNRDETGGSKGNLDHIVVGLREAVEDLVWFYKDMVQFRELSVLWEAAGENLNQVSNLVLRRETAAFVDLLRHCNKAANELSLDRILESIGDHVRSERVLRTHPNHNGRVRRDINTKTGQAQEGVINLLPQQRQHRAEGQRCHGRHGSIVWTTPEQTRNSWQEYIKFS